MIKTGVDDMHFLESYIIQHTLFF